MQGGGKPKEIREFWEKEKIIKRNAKESSIVPFSVFSKHVGKSEP